MSNPVLATRYLTPHAPEVRAAWTPGRIEALGRAVEEDGLDFHHVGVRSLAYAALPVVPMAAQVLADESEPLGPRLRAFDIVCRAMARRGDDEVARAS